MYLQPAKSDSPAAQAWNKGGWQERRFKMETLGQPESRGHGARLLITAATVLIALASCARIESFSSRARVADDVTLITLLAQSQKEQGRKQNLAAAHRALKEADLAALKSKLWESMFDVGDGYMRIGAGTEARRCYLIALYRARAEGSVDGVLRVAEALGVLGERAIAAQALAIGQQLANETSDRRLSGQSAAESLEVVH